MKLRKMFLSSLLVASVLSTNVIFASTNLQKGVIPSEMLPGTIITFNEENIPVITNQGSSNLATQNIEITDMNMENPEIPNSSISLDEFNKTLEEISLEAKDLPVYFIEDEKPQPGTIVTYGSDGQINTIENASQDNISTYATAANGTYVYGSDNNTITITSSKVSGVGRFTVFEDTYGDNDNVLVAGDVATKAAYDNPKSGTKITATANGIVKTLTKNDNGLLPNAVLDLKNWSGKMFGYTYSNTLSFDGSYYYNR